MQPVLCLSVCYFPKVFILDWYKQETRNASICKRHGFVNGEILEHAGVLCSYRQLFGLSWDRSVDSLSHSWTSNSNLSIRLSSCEVSGIFIRF